MGEGCLSHTEKKNEKKERKKLGKLDEVDQLVYCTLILMAA